MALMSTRNHRSVAAEPVDFGPYDVACLGALCKRVREARAISGATMASYCSAKSTRTITQDFEVNNQLGPEYFDRYVKALQSREVTLSPITPMQAQMLTQWYYEREPSIVAERTKEVSSIRFEYIHHSNPYRPAALADLVQELSEVRRPGVIMDDLWYIHALNEGQLRMYGIRSDDAFLQRWDGWHTIASKIWRDSPVRLAHNDAAGIVPPTIVFFLENPSTYPYLFTYPTRAFLSRLNAYSEAEEADVHRWWPYLTSFTLPHNAPAVPREITVNGSTFYTIPSIDKSIVVPAGSGDGAQNVHYMLVTWNVIWTTNGEVRASLEAPGPQTVYFARDYDTQRDFHVNTWPHVADYLRTVG